LQSFLATVFRELKMSQVHFKKGLFSTLNLISVSEKSSLPAFDLRRQLKAENIVYLKSNAQYVAMDGVILSLTALDRSVIQINYHSLILMNSHS